MNQEQTSQFIGSQGFCIFVTLDPIEQHSPCPVPHIPVSPDQEPRNVSTKRSPVIQENPRQQEDLSNLNLALFRFRMCRSPPIQCPSYNVPSSLSTHWSSTQPCPHTLYCLSLPFFPIQDTLPWLFTPQPYVSSLALTFCT